ncbi:MAG: LOG family protein [Planctomycetia bacterium]
MNQSKDRPAAAIHRPGRDESAETRRFVDEIKDTAEKLIEDGADRGDVKLLSRLLRELRYAFRVLAPFRGRHRVSVFGSARTPPDNPSYKMAVEFGKEMADAGYLVITGGGNGIMEAAHVGAGRPASIGLNIMLPFEQAPNPVIADDPKLVWFRYFFSRKLVFLKETSALALFPGGFGTLDEGFEILTMLQTGKAATIPVVMVEPPGGDYWLHFLNYMRNELLVERLVSEFDFHLFRRHQTVDGAVDEITRFYRVYHSQRYVRNQLVLRLQRPISESLIAALRSEFADILTDPTKLTLGPAHPDEANEPELAHLPRLYVPFTRNAFGRLRLLIDRLNDAVEEPRATIGAG